MPLDRLPPDVDLIYALPGAGEVWDPHVIYTNYFAFSIPEARIGAFIYLRCQPAFPLCAGGVSFFRGHNDDALEAEHFDYEVTMPWPDVTENSVTTANNLRFEFVEPGKTIRLTYTSNDGNTRLDVLAEAVSFLVSRGNAMPGEEMHHTEMPEHGGTEQFMHYTGELVLNGKTYTVDSYDARDRSWNQIRTERQDAVRVPPTCWMPMYFGPDLALNHLGWESHDTDPLWPAVYDLPPEKVEPVFGWTYSAVDDEALRIVRTRREVLERHPVTYMPLRQTLRIEDERGRVLDFDGAAIASIDMPMWPNANMRIAVYRWTDDAGRESHTIVQELWFDAYQKLLKKHFAAPERAVLTGSGI